MATKEAAPKPTAVEQALIDMRNHTATLDARLHDNDKQPLGEAERRKIGYDVLDKLDIEPPKVNMEKGLAGKRSMLPEEPAPSDQELTNYDNDMLAGYLDRVNNGLEAHVVNVYEMNSPTLQAVEAQRVLKLAEQRGADDIASVALHSALTFHHQAATPRMGDERGTRGVTRDDLYLSRPTTAMQAAFNNRVQTPPRAHEVVATAEAFTAGAAALSSTKPQVSL